MANGQTLVSPTNEIIISIKVESGQKGERGLTGLTPQLTVTNTITGEPNTNASVTIGGTAENPGLTFTIPRGTPFDIAAEYPSVVDLTNGTNPIPIGYTPTLFDLAIITSTVEDPENARLYIYDEAQGSIGAGWTFVSDLSGATGPVRGLRWKPDNGGTTSILQWQNNDGSWDEINERDLSLSFSFDDTELTISNVDGDTATQELGAYAEFGNGTNATVTSSRFSNPNGSLTSFQELGVYASFDGTELTLTNPDTTTVQQELALDFNWDGTTLQIKNPAEASYDPGNEQKLSPDISFDTSNGVQISVVEPDAASNFIKISPDITFDTDDGVFVSIVEPEGTEDLVKISPDIYFDGTSIAIMEPGVAPTPGDYVDLKGDTGDAAEAGTSLFRLRDEDDNAGAGFLVTVSSEIQFLGQSGIEVKRDSGTYTVELIEVDGGEF